LITYLINTTNQILATIKRGDYIMKILHGVEMAIGFNVVQKSTIKTIRTKLTMHLLWIRILIKDIIIKR